ncbi:FxsA family protein [Halomonas urumqiensis]|uniref:Exlusion protein FxsA n=1 Tax=Halomonas urumqiensis TaxID=1684789 RepID=A0A2N7UQJ6_9GAMM|nr:FxsA family protein [Halomonas urumqiensis]PMR82706.1 exlusion protein FxsA [Halomonas urumqiensis]PTB01975.1 exlusion protein FxsA [Halomonas urumqiensis]GHE22088.1 phage exclusion suppressor FxsA [Halomonas urumqiensis]
MPFLLAFTVFALLDFVVLFSVGSHIGLLTTLLMVLATGFIGLHLIRREGVATFARAQERMAKGEIPTGELFTGAALIFGGALLMAPGFISDTLGFLCLIPDARRLLGKLLARLGVRAQGIHVHAHGRTDGKRDWSSTSQANGTDQEWQQADAQRSDEKHSDAHQPNDPIEGEYISGDERRR